MKGKNKALIFFTILLEAGFFWGGNFVIANDCNDHIVISEIYGGGGNSGSYYKNDFIELYNPTTEAVVLDDWSVQYASASGTAYSSTVLSEIIEANSYYLIQESAGSGGEQNLPTPNAAGTIGISATAGKVALVKNNKKISHRTDEGVIDFVGYGSTANEYEIGAAPAPDNTHSIARTKDCLDGNNNFSDFTKSAPTPQNSFWKEPEPIPEPEPKIYSNKVYINEILPNADEEFIELYNPAEKGEDLSGWALCDASKTCKKYSFPENSEIKAGGYAVIYSKKDYKFALNNSGAESVYLYNPDEILISQVAYNGAKENISYNFDGTNWRWSKFLTPGTENKFNNLPQSKTKKDKKIYAGVPAEFSASAKDADKDKLKYTWDFGDGHKSYKKDTKHTFEKAGKYNVILKINDGSEDKIETFKIKVEKFPKTKIKITAVVPNPKGKDSELEYLVVENKSKKKINLKDWIVATGSQKLYNHLITEDLIIKPGEKINLTRQFSKFSLNNKKSKIELRYPNGKIAHEIKYSLKESAPEDTRYEKTQLGWAWIEKNIQKNTEVKTAEFASNFLENKTIVDDGARVAESLKPGGQSLARENKNFQEKIILALTQETEQKIEKYLPVQKTIILAQENNQYIFADYYVPQKHYLVEFLEEITGEINLFFRKLFY